MKKLLTFLIIGMFLISFTSALDVDNVKLDISSKETITIGDTNIEYKNIWETYSPIEIKNFLGLGETYFSGAITEHTETCGESCLSEMTIYTSGDYPLIEDIYFETILEDGNRVKQDVRNYELSYWGEINDYEYKCIDSKEVSLNGTIIQECSNVLIGKHDGWINYNLGEILKDGTYKIKLTANKKPSRSVDWIIKTSGETLSEWATWGAVIGVGGVEANVTLNSPADGSTQYVNEITLNATANVTGGSSLVNATLYDNSTGTWGARNTTTLSGGNSVSDAHGLAISNSLARTNYGGERFKANKDLILNNVTKEASCTATKAHLLDASKNNLANATFVGETAIFSNYALISGTTYYIVADSDGASYTQRSQGAHTYPVNDTNINWTGGVLNGADDANQAVDIVSVYTSDTSTYSIQTFNNTYTTGTKWNMQFCDSDGDCGFAVNNYTFIFDTSAPSIFINAGNGTQDYGSLTTNHTINFTATDTNIDKCWINYNGTNKTLSCTSGVLVSTNFTMVLNMYNATIWSNDTAGNTISHNVNWTYNIFENSQTYSSTTFETASETFYVNVTTNGTSITSPEFIYDGTSYTATATNISGNTYNLSYTKIIPVGNGTKYFNFNITINGQEFSTTNTSILVNQTVFTFCNTTYATPFLNITFKDESDLSVINGSMTLADFTYYLNSVSVNKTYQFINTSENNYYTFCATPNRTLNVDSRIQYESTGYPQRVWNPDATTYTNSTTTQVLYLLGSADGIYVTFQVVNSASSPLGSVEVTATRSIGGSDVTVGQGTTGDDGSVTFWLNPDFTHTFTFVKTGFTTYTTSLAPTQSSYTITMGGSTTSVNDSYFQGITTKLLPTNTSLTNDTSYTFGLQVNSSYWSLTEYGFNLRLINGTTITGGSSTTSGTLITFAYNTNNQTRIYLDYYWLVNGTYTNSTIYWNVYNTEYTQWSIARFFTDLTLYIDSDLFGLDNFGRSLIVFIILFMTVGIVTYKYGASSPVFIAGIIFGIIYFFDVGIGLIPSITIGSRTPEHLLTFIAGIMLLVAIFREVQS